MVDNSVVVTPLVATNSDEELGNELVTQVPPDSNYQKAALPEGISNSGRQWKLLGASLILLLIAVGVVMGIMLCPNPQLSVTPQEDLSEFLPSISFDG